MGGRGAHRVHVLCVLSRVDCEQARRAEMGVMHCALCIDEIEIQLGTDKLLAHRILGQRGDASPIPRPRISDMAADRKQPQ